MGKKFRCAVIGMGILGSQHAERLYAHEGTEIVAVCDMKAEKARNWAGQHACRWYEDFREMYEKENLDLIVVATQDPYHKEPIIQACEQKIPYVISEKPLTTSVKEAYEIKEAAEKSGTCIKVLFPNRFYPLDRAIRMMLKEGGLGTPEFGEMRMDDSIDVPRNLWGKDSKNFSAISSPVFFLLSHAVDLLHYYFAPRKIIKVYAKGKQSVIGSEFDYMDSFLTFEDGLLIRLKTEWTKRMEELVENYVQVTGEKGGFSYNKTPGFKVEQGLRIYIEADRKNAEKILESLEKEGICAALEYSETMQAFRFDLKAERENDFDWNSGVCIYADSFREGLEGKVSLTDLNDGIRQVEVVEALLKSAKEGREVEV